MTTFKSLFKQMFLQKRRYAHLVLLLQIFAVIFIFVFSINSNEYKSLFVIGNKTNNWDILFWIGCYTTVISDLIFLGLLCWQNEKINLSQTWQLVPVSSIKIWLTNIFSGLIECVYIFIIQVIFGILVITFDCLSKKVNFFTEITKSAAWNWSWADFEGIIELLIYLISICLIVFTFVSFSNLLTRTIIDQLPGKNTLIIKILVMALLVIIAVFIAAKLNDQVLFMYYSRTKAVDYDNVDLLIISIVEYLAGTIVLGIVNCILVDKFVEPKIK